MHDQTRSRRSIPRPIVAWIALAGFVALAYVARGVGPSDASAADDPHEGMVLVPGGTFAMGAEFGHEDESPVHEVRVEPFLLDRTEVSNHDFARFVTETGYQTEAEKSGGCWAYVRGNKDFAFVPDASWKQPEGAASTIHDRMDHPVVCVSWNDATAYARWAGKRLPTEQEWEFAARAGGGSHAVANLATSKTGGHHDSHHVVIEANVWQGTWPQDNQLADGYYYTAPIASFPGNALGLHDMIGNVWEWSADWYAPDTYARVASLHGGVPTEGETRVARGGSWFCSSNYCGAYNTHFRGASPPDHAFNNVGFRCAADLDTQGATERKS